MKISFAALAAAAAAAAPAAVHASGEAEILDPDCWLVDGWGDNGGGTGLAVTGSGSFHVIPGSQVTCRVDGRVCNGEFNAYFKFGSAPTSSDNDFSLSDTGNGACIAQNIEFEATFDATEFFYDISVTGLYELVGMACYCDDGGFYDDFIADNVATPAYEAANWLVDFIGQETIGDVGFYLYNDFGCFSESAVADVRGKGTVAMKDLELGDMVLTEGNAYEPIYTFGHRDPNSPSMEFVRITTTAATEGTKEDPLELTGNHMVATADGRNVRADRLRIGDRLVSARGDGAVVVTKIKTVAKSGLYMPLTPSGKIVVNGIVASNYISLDDKTPAVAEHSKRFFSFSGETPDHLLSHWWLSPFRMLCMGVSSRFCGSIENRGILPWLVYGWNLAEAAESQPAFVRVVFFGIPTFVVFGMFNAVEHVFLGPSVAPGLFVLTVVALVLAKKMKKAVNGADTTELTKKLLVPQEA